MNTKIFHKMRSHKIILKFQNYLFFSAIYYLFNALSFFKFQECQDYDDKIFQKMEYNLKGHSRSYKTTFMLKSFLHIRLSAGVKSKNHS